jgi:hypothetical protein
LGFVVPYMINPDAGDLGAKVGFVFFAFGVPLCVLFYFFAPETKGLSFDEVCAAVIALLPHGIGLYRRYWRLLTKLLFSFL